MTHLLSPLLSAASEPHEIYTYNHPATVNAHAHKRTNLWFDPLLDNVLNPARGETLWFEKSKWIQIPGYKDPFKISGDIEITLSPIAYLTDYSKIHAGLADYTNEKLDVAHFCRTLLKTPYLSKPVALTAQAVIVFELDKLILKIGLLPTMTFLDQVERCIFSRGVRRSYINLENSKKAMGPLFPVIPERTALAETLLSNGYRLTGEFHQLSKNTYEQRFYKELPDPAFLPETTCMETEFEWILKPDDQSLPPKQFGIYVRKNGIIRGGLFGIANIDKAFIPHTYLHTFWIDPSIRGTGLGSRIINLTFDYSKQRGAEVIELGTMDFQAPLFYEKMGFTKVHTEPNMLITRDGKLNNGYLFRRPL